MRKKIIFINCIVSAWLSFAAIAHADTVKVTVKPFADVAVYPQVKIPADVISLNKTQVSAEVGGIIKKVHVLAGETVKKGQVLLELDKFNYQQAVKRAKAAIAGLQARLELAEYQLQRAKILSEQAAASEELYKQRQTDVKTLRADIAAQKAALSMAEKDLARCTIRAPFNAVLSKRFAQEGALANIGEPLLQLIDADRIEISARLQQTDLAMVDGNDEFVLLNGKKQYRVKIDRITPVIDSIDRSREVRLHFINETALPGTNGELLWQASVPHIPAHLISRRNGQLGVFIAGRETAKFVPLPNAEEGQSVASDLAMNAPLIIEGRFLLKADTAISRVE